MWLVSGYFLVHSPKNGEYQLGYCTYSFIWKILYKTNVNCKIPFRTANIVQKCINEKTSYSKFHVNSFSIFEL